MNSDVTMQLRCLDEDVYTCLQPDRGFGWSNSGLIARGGGLVVDTFWDLPRTRAMLDLYAGVGLFAALLGEAVGPSGSVLAVEASSRACADAARNTDDQPWVRVRTAPVEVGLVRGLAISPTRQLTC